MIIALIGNQNSGKTTLFNQLTGSNQRVGNFPGVTVEGKRGELQSRKDAKVSIIDLPGIYSLSPYSDDEIVTRNSLMSKEVDGVINIVDASNIERNLYLTMQLLQLNIPMVVALNMIDEVRDNGGAIDVEGLSKALGVKIVLISALKKEGLTDLTDTIIEVVNKKEKPLPIDDCDGAVHRAIHSVMYMVEDHAKEVGLPSKYIATKLIEKDEIIQKQLNLSQNELELIDHTIVELEGETKLDYYCALASARYKFIESICSKFVKKPEMSKEQKRSLKIDSILTHRYLGLPIFFGIMFLVFWLTFGVIGAFLSDLLVLGIDQLGSAVSELFLKLDINPVVHSLVIDGIFSGVGSVLSFLPIIVTLFFFLSILEDSGYMTRVAFIMDRLLRKIGLSGKSFVPMLIGFGCTVPAVMSTRTLSSKRDRFMTIFLLPFISCSAKLPIYAVFSYAFFKDYAPLAMIALYLLGIIVGIIMALIMKKTKYKGEPIPFVMELPNYRFPSFKTTTILLWEKAKDFIVRAFTVIFVATIVIWFLRSFDFKLNYLAQTENSSSILSGVAKFIAPIFTPVGFGNYQSVTALITGFIAKEAVISTLAVLTLTDISSLGSSLLVLFTPMAAVSFLVFVLLYTPCVASIKAINMELKSKKLTALLILSQLGIAYFMSFAIFQIGSLLEVSL